MGLMGCSVILRLQKGDEVDGRLFETQPDAGLRMFLAQCPQPFPQGFGGGGNDCRPALAGASVDEAEVGLLVGTVQADDEVIRMRRVHKVVCFG